MPCKLGISSMSLGRCFAGHGMARKLDMAHKYGYQGIEVFIEDLVDMAQKLSVTSPSSSSMTTTPSFSPSKAELAAAGQLRQMCADRDLEIICLQPFMHYEGLVDRAEHAARINLLVHWIDLAHALGTDLIHIPSSFLPADQATGDTALIVADLRKAADLCARVQPPLRLSYEALAWATHVRTWERSWEIVRLVDRPNFGLCLDSFNIAAAVYADPASPTGVTPGGEAAILRSLKRLVADVDVEKVFYVQVVDAEKLAEPLVKGHPFYNAQQPARQSWSRNCRLFYGERDQGAYLPVRAIASAFFQGLRFEGWVSLELFNRKMSDPWHQVPEELARRGAISWGKLVKDVKLRTESPVVIPESPSL